MSILKCTFIQIFIHFPVLYLGYNPIENFGRIEKVAKIAIIKQPIESMCINEALLEKCKICRRETICSKMLIFKSKMF
jgi:hypothetical protein